METVSVIMPTYNCGTYIRESIWSVQKQTYTDWELIVMDDCSTDDTAQIVQEFCVHDPRVHYYQMEQNGGPAAARNQAIAHASGTYIAFLDSDDLWRADKLEKQIAFMQKHGCNFSCTAYACIDEGGRPCGKTVMPFSKAGYKTCLYYGNCIGNSTAMYRVGEWGKFYAPDIRKRNDFALWLRILKKENYVFGLKEVLADYRIRENSVSANKNSLIRYQWQLYRDIEKLNLAQCGLAFGTLFARKLWLKVRRG